MLYFCNIKGETTNLWLNVRSCNVESSSSSSVLEMPPKKVNDDVHRKGKRNHGMGKTLDGILLYWLCLALAARAYRYLLLQGRIAPRLCGPKGTWQNPVLLTGAFDSNRLPKHLSGQSRFGEEWRPWHCVIRVFRVCKRQTFPSWPVHLSQGWRCLCRLACGC